MRLFCALRQKNSYVVGVKPHQTLYNPMPTSAFIPTYKNFGSFAERTIIFFKFCGIDFILLGIAVEIHTVA